MLFYNVKMKNEWHRWNDRVVVVVWFSLLPNIEFTCVTVYQ